MNIRAAQVKTPWQFAIRNVDLPNVPPEGWIRLRVEACGICGTDVINAGGPEGDWTGFGHEIAGVVEALGPSVDGIEHGQRVVLESNSFCGRCNLCRDGRGDLCNDKAPTFWAQEAMGFSEQMLAPACCVVPYEDLEPEVACQAEPCGVAYDMVKTAAIEMGDRVCLVGPGPIGLAALALAKHRGAARLTAIGRAHSEQRLRLAREMGAEVITHDGPLSERKDLRGQFDHVLMTAPPACIESTLPLLAYGGEMTYIGLGEGRVSFDGNDFHFRKLQLRASFASPAMYFPAVLRLLEAGVIPAERFVSHVFTLDQMDLAMRTLRDDKPNAVKVIIRPDSHA